MKGRLGAGAAGGRLSGHRFILLLWPALAALSPAECPPVERAYEKLLASSFEVERSFRVSVNGDLKKREVARLRYTAGELDTEVVEEEILSKSMTFEGEGKDLALDVGFACERVEELGDGRFEVTSEDGTETAELTLDAEREALRPVGWRLEITERLLFKKFVIEGSAEYSGFRWK